MNTAIAEVKVIHSDANMNSGELMVMPMSASFFKKFEKNKNDMEDESIPAESLLNKGSTIDEDIDVDDALGRVVANNDDPISVEELQHILPVFECIQWKCGQTTR